VKCNEDRSNDKGDEIPKGASIAHRYLQKEKLVYVSFDIETAGESCGIVQLSAQIFRMVHRNGITESEIEEETFNKYIQPRYGMRRLAPFVDCRKMMIEL